MLLTSALPFFKKCLSFTLLILDKIKYFLLRKVTKYTTISQKTYFHDFNEQSSEICKEQRKWANQKWVLKERTALKVEVGNCGLSQKS